LEIDRQMRREIESRTEEVQNSSELLNRNQLIADWQNLCPYQQANQSRAKVQ
jgi:hypothetical protein